MLMDQVKQFEFQLKQTCLVTWPSATVEWAPINTRIPGHIKV